MYTDEEMTLEAIRDGMSDEVIDKHIEGLSDDDKWETVAELTGDDWTPRQIELFAAQAAGWSHHQQLQIHVNRYRGLALRRQKTPGELLDTVLNNELSRRRTANWDEKRRIEEAKVVSEALTADDV